MMKGNVAFLPRVLTKLLLFTISANTVSAGTALSTTQVSDSFAKWTGPFLFLVANVVIYNLKVDSTAEWRLRRILAGVFSLVLSFLGKQPNCPAAHNSSQLT
jgi:hypothetical protein